MLNAVARSQNIARTPVLMADGSEKAIENIQIAEIVLAWNVPPNAADRYGAGQGSWWPHW